jgi:nucleotide-binding universal stress UspA family protein
MTSPEHVVLVPLDGSEHAKVALPVARTWAALDRASLHIVYVARADAGEEASALPARLALGPAEAPHAVVHSRTGDPATAIVELAREYEHATVVLCARTIATDPAATAHTAERVITGAPGPIVFVPQSRGQRPWEVHKVLVPHDGTPSATHALAPVARIVNAANAQVFVLHVATPGGEHRGETGELTAPRYVDQAQHEWPAWTDEFLGRLAHGCPVDPTAITMKVARGAAATAALGFAAEHAIDLIVLTWYGGLDERRAAVFKRVLRESPCPVLLLRRDAE